MNDQDEKWCIDKAAETLRESVRLDSSFDARVMDAVRKEAPAWSRAALVTRTGARRSPAWRAAGGWLVRPRMVRIAPIGGLAAAAAVLLAVSIASRQSAVAEQVGQPESPVVAAAPRTDTTIVRFVLVALGASTVALVGDFNDWNVASTPLDSPADDGVWTIAVALPPGRHQYAFMVDGERWVTDPSAPTAVEDSFGLPNSVVTVGESTE